MIVGSCHRSDGLDVLFPEKLMKMLNKVIFKTSERRLTMTFFIAIFDLQASKVYFSNAGHDIPFVKRKGQKKL